MPSLGRGRERLYCKRAREIHSQQRNGATPTPSVSLDFFSQTSFLYRVLFITLFYFVYSPMAFKLAETNICRRWLQDLGVFNVFCSARQPSDKRPGRSHQLRLPCGIFLLLVIASTYFCYLFFRRFIIADRCVFQKRFLYRQGGTDGSMVRPKGINPLVKEKQSPAKMTKTEKPGKNSSFGSAWSDTAVSYTAAALSSSCSFFLSFC